MITEFNQNNQDRTPEVRELTKNETEEISGGRTLFEELHRIWFAAKCIADGNQLTVKGDQLQCRL